MNHRNTIILLGFLLSVTSSVAGDNIRDDSKDLQGSWRIIDLEANGEKKPLDEYQGITVNIENSELWAVKPTGTDPKLKFSLDPRKSPKSIDLTVIEGDDKGKVVLGIYSIRDGRLRLAINIFGEPSYRPTEFMTRDRDGVAFATLERIKGK